jgi:hydrogenase/urease accessory protein HupE
MNLGMNMSPNINPNMNLGMNMSLPITMTRIKTRSAGLLAALAAAPAMAHPGHMQDPGLFTELSHWLTEPDHLLLLGAGVLLLLGIGTWVKVAQRRRS